MASINSKYVVVKKYITPKAEGDFTVAQVIGDEVWKGVIVELPDQPVFLGNRQLVIDDVVIFTPYSPDTYKIEDLKFVAISDLLKVL